jgi:redox-sensitive bicupin YhaK (pirin superfamily)
VLYVFDGDRLCIDGQDVPSGNAAVVAPDRELPLVGGDQPVEVLLLQGRPIGEPVSSYGPFVMNTRQEIQQAFADYQRTQFGGWPWADRAPTHGKEGRFAKRPDGKIERAT